MIPPTLLRPRPDDALMSLDEIALGAVHRPSEVHPPRTIVPVHRPPNEVLGDALRTILQRGRLAIAFSGGVDSSGLLCLATTIARQEGLHVPIPVTARFPHAPSTDESRWQDLVVRHLGLDDWVRVPFRDECDVIGVEAQPGLLAHGVRWPPLVHAEQPLVRAAAAAGATIYALGNGGDELTFPTRAGTLQLVARGTVRRNRVALRAVVADLVPSLDRVPLRHARVLPPWITAEARPRLTELVREHQYRRTFRWASALDQRTNAPWARRGHATVVGSGVELGVEVVQPLTDVSVIGAMLASGGPWGFPDRPSAALALYGASLPDEVRWRKDKVDFTAAYLAAPSRAFIRTWDGTGIPTRLVDGRVLAKEWRSSSPRYSSIPLLQHAWLARHRR